MENLIVSMEGWFATYKGAFKYSFFLFISSMSCFFFMYSFRCSGENNSSYMRALVMNSPFCTKAIVMRITASLSKLERWDWDHSIPYILSNVLVCNYLLYIILIFFNVRSQDDYH